MSLHLEPSVVFGDGVGKVDALPLGQELPQLGPLLHAQIIPHEIPVDAVPAPLFEVVEDAGSWEGPQRGAGLTWLSAGGSEPPPKCHMGHGSKKWGLFYAMGGTPAP